MNFDLVDQCWPMSSQLGAHAGPNRDNFGHSGSKGSRIRASAFNSGQIAASAKLWDDSNRTWPTMWLGLANIGANLAEFGLRLTLVLVLFMRQYTSARAQGVAFFFLQQATSTSNVAGMRTGAWPPYSLIPVVGPPRRN